jgi:hypothetical protein
LGGPGGKAEVGVDDADTLGVPATGVGALFKVVLEYKTLFIAQDLARAGLADVDEGEAVAVVGLDEFGAGHG